MKFIIPALTIFTFSFFFLNCSQKSIDFPQEHAIILSDIDEEIQTLETIGNTNRFLSDSLIFRIAVLANNLKPYEDKSLGTEKKLSRERGVLLSSLVHKKLNPTTYKEIFKITTFEHAFLEEADLSNAPLDNILLNQSFFKHVNLSNASLVNANLCKAHFKNVNLRGANLHIANLRDADLDGSNLTKANLESAYLVNAKLLGVQAEGAILDNANLAGANLSQTAKGLGNN